jgi:MoCo/4Fe-4S cofactor protein with predicted Tat translocation signal
VSGKKYWKSLDQLEESPQFTEWLEKEFPDSVKDIVSNPVSRRGFLQLMGASMALAGITLTGCRRPEAHLVPYTKSAEWIVPGKALQYATAMSRRVGAMPLLVTTFEGRPTKIEGNKGVAGSNGSTDVFAQASILDLYDPDRAKKFKHNGQTVDVASFNDALENLRKEFSETNGEGLAFLVEDSSAPTWQRLQKEVSKQFPKSVWYQHDPLGLDAESQTTRTVFGEPLRAVYNFKKADIILSLGSNFLDPEEGGLDSVRDFSARRRIKSNKDSMNRLYVAENRFTLTGGMADHRLRIPASQIGEVGFMIAEALVELGVKELEDVTKAVRNFNSHANVDPKWIKETARDLFENKGNSLIIVGKEQPAGIHALGYFINKALLNLRKTIKFQASSGMELGHLADLQDAVSSRSINTLFILGGNPAYTAPRGLEWNKLQKSVSNVLYWGLHENETASVSNWVIPGAHFLESWGDSLGEEGTYLSAQPMILPLYGGISQLQLLSQVAGVADKNGPEAIQKTYAQITGKAFDARAWQRFVHDGFLKDSKAGSVNPNFDTAAAKNLVRKQLSKTYAVDSKNLEVVFTPSPNVNDGRYNNNGWLQELPDSFTKLTWDNAALISPQTAKDLELKTEDVVEITVNGQSVEAPIMVAPGHADNSISLELGFGRKIVGRVGKGTGFDAYPLRSNRSPYFSTGASLNKTDKTYQLATTQNHQSMEGRALVREATLDEYKKEPNFVDHVGVASHGPKIQSYYKNPEMTGKQQWGMAIDLSACTGCNACSIACTSENNIPIVGKDQVSRGREMQWIRIDNYYTGDENNPENVMEPVACQHCENAPCETVCPVNATVHSEDGLNVMTYNRCIGTRYCANNCPYKVRRFNYFDYNQRPLDELYVPTPLTKKGMPETLQMQKNPNVTVRMRGVMEKCTYCVQRIEGAKQEAKVEAGASNNIKIKTDTVESACQQACPAEAIVFGDIKDPNSKVSKLKKLDRDYEMLSYLAIFPRTSYLAKIRNLNSRMPGVATAHKTKEHAKAGGQH